MPIQSDDIKLLKSAVMADVPEGGGGATGIEIIDGQSNNIFPDTSTDDRAGGRFQLRKIFGAAHTSDTDTLMGASFAVLAPPADPLVHVALFETPGWADERTAAIDMVQRYLVKGPVMACKIMGTHYTGSMLLQLYQKQPASNFPAAGDAVVVRNPDGQEQYVRVLRVAMSTGTFTDDDGDFTVNIATCELGQEIEFDVIGGPIVQASNVANAAQVYTTTPATGARFHGVKQLADAASVGDRFVMADGGIYSPLVPAATVEQPLIDITPLTTRAALCRTSSAPLTLPAQTLTLQPGTVLKLPTAMQPSSLTITRGATVFTDDGAGNLLQGTTPVGVVSYVGKTVTMLGGSPSYGSASTVIAYRPVTPSGAATHSSELLITAVNQGLAFTAAFEPVPAPGTLSIAYQAQSRWYELTDNANGKISGGDSSYGSGQINYTSGSIAVTLGAIPDVGSSLLYMWGDSATAVAMPAPSLPTRLQASLQISAASMLGTEVLTWSRGGASYTASVNASGELTGDATGTREPGVIVFQPSVLPDSAVTIEFDKASTPSTGATHTGGGSYTLQSTPAMPGSISFTLPILSQAGYAIPASMTVTDDGYGALICRSACAYGLVVGSVNYTTGAIAINATAVIDAYRIIIETPTTPPPAGTPPLYFERLELTSYTATLLREAVGQIAHSAGSIVSDATTITPAWGLALPVLSGLMLKTDALAFSVGDSVYTATGGALQAGWNAVTGQGSPAGSVSSAGVISITSLPGNGINALTWSNVAQDKQSPRVGQGVFRVQSAPIKTGVFQIQAGSLVGNSNNSGVISGGGWYGNVDFQRGIVRWNRTNAAMGAGSWSGGWAAWDATDPVSADELTYNAVFLQYVPLDADLLGVETARLPLDGKVPIFRAGGQVLVHHTMHTQLPNPLTKGTAYSLGRERIAAATVRTATGARVSGALYTVDFDGGEIVFPVGSDLTGLAQPFDVEHRIEDELLALSADISGKITLVAGLTHDYPAGESYVSSKLRKGDLFARAYGYTDQATWTGVWSDSLIGSEPLASYNHTDYPISVTNRGAITERWALIFLNSTTVRVVGEYVGQIMTGVSVNEAIVPINPHTSAPYFTIPALGWGGGWVAGNVLRFNTAACGSAAWVSRAVLQGPATVASDSAVIAFRADVDA